MPNFIFLELPPRPREEGFKPERNSIPVSDLSKEEAIAYSLLMSETFMDHWNKKVKG